MFGVLFASVLLLPVSQKPFSGVTEGMKAITKLLCFLSVLALCSVYVFGQRESGTITGTVTDPSGAVVSGATVTAKSVGTGAVRTATTTSSGAYTIAGLQPGQYDVTVESPNFAKFTQRVSVTVGSTNEVSAKLAVAGQGTTVEVVGTGGGTQVETQSSELSQVVSGTSVTQLPSLTRNPYDFVATAGNVGEDATPNGAGSRGAGGMSINGQRTSSTDILLDGAENVDTFTASVGQQVPLDSVQEFRVTTTDFSAEYGRASGGVVNVATKSGTNAFHGSAYEFNRISSLASNTYDNGANGIPKQVFTRNQFGYSIGGPVVKDKLFFFNSTEWIRVRSNATQLAYVLDPAFLALTSPNTQAFFNAYGHVKPGATTVRTLTAADLISEGFAGGTGGPFETLVPAGTPVEDEVRYSYPADVGGGSPQNTWQSVVRLDYNMTDKTQMFGRYAVYHDNFFPGTVSSNAYAGFDTGEKDLLQNALFSITHIWSPTILSNTKFSFNRLNGPIQPLGPAGVSPNMYYTTGGQISIGPDSQTTMLPGYLPQSTGNAIPFGGPQNIGQIAHDVSWTHGKHQFKFGGQYIYLRDNRVFGAYEEGENFLANTNSSDAFDVLMNGSGLYRFSAAIYPQGKFPCFHDVNTGATIKTPACALTSPLTPPVFDRSNRYNDFAFYGMDTWKITNRLTLNLGIRWEYYGVQHNKNHALDSNIQFPSAPNFFQQIAGAYVGQGNNNTPGQNLQDNTLWQPEYRDFAPRIGFAYDVFGDGKTSLRGGYGIAYERNFGNVTYNIIQNPPNYGVVQLQQPGVPISTSNFGPLGGNVGTIYFPSPSLRAVDPHIKTAYDHMWNLSVEREVARNTVVALEYAGSRGMHLYSIQNINDVGMGVTYLGYPGASTSTSRMNLQYAAVNFRGSTGDNYHNALNTRFQTNNIVNSGLSLTANYTWSHTIDNLSATFGGSDETNSQTLGYLDAFQPRLDLGDSDYDIRHRLVVSAIWDVPLARNSNGFMKQVAGGWELAPIFNARTGYPFTLYDCTFDGQYNCPRYIPSGPTPLSGTTNTSAGNSSGPNVFNYLTPPLAVAYNPPNGWGSGLPTCTGLFGVGCSFPADMTRRNAFRQPGYWNMNFGIYKNFKLTERFNMQFRSEFYNLFNHSNYYVQTGQVVNVSGLVADINNTPFNNFAPCVQSFFNGTGPGCSSGQLEQVAPFSVSGKKGVVNGNYAGSLGERRFVQFALKLTF